MRSLIDFVGLQDPVNILDIGAVLGERPTYQSLIDAGRARLIGFEPNADECDRLNRSYGPPHQFFPFFVGDGNPATFYETNWVQTGSLFVPNMRLLEKFQNLAELTTMVDTHDVVTKRLDDIDAIEDVDFIKIDVQGSELAVLQHATRVLSYAVCIQTEVEFVELYKNQPMFAQVDSFLREKGFQFHTFWTIGGRSFKPLVRDKDVNRGFRQMLWADAVYVRDWMNLDVLSIKKLKKYAVLAHDLFGSFDLAHLALTAVDRKSGSAIAKDYVKELSSPQSET